MLAGGLLVTLLHLPCSLLAAELPVLSILDWEDCLDPELAAEFGAKHRVAIRETNFSSDTERDQRLAATGGTGFDLVVVDQAQLPVYRDRGWIAALDASRVPGLRHYEPRWRPAGSASASHAIPFAWGTVGIAYRADLVRQPPRSWLALFQPDEQLCGKLSVFGDIRELVATALKATGSPANATDPGAYAKAERLLSAQRACVSDYGTAGSTADAGLVTGRIRAAMAYNTNATLADFNPNIRFVLPDEGGLIWVDYMAILASSGQKELALAFLEFLSDPANAARQALFSHAGTPNRAALARLPADVRQNQTIYPTGTQFDASEMLVAAPSPVMAMRNKIQAKVVRKE
jgi:spermidine/putrescine transport system substrate-binding protein